jgi:hypothetical protein
VLQHRVLAIGNGARERPVATILNLIDENKSHEYKNNKKPNPNKWKRKE